MKRLIAGAAVCLGMAATQVVVAAPAQACHMDASWFFLHTCAPDQGPPGPPPPPGPRPPTIACDETHCGPDVPIPCSGPGAPCG